MSRPDIPQRPVEPTPHRPAHRDSMLESLGKAITDPVREAAGEEGDEVDQARHRARGNILPQPPGNPGKGR